MRIHRLLAASATLSAMLLLSCAGNQEAKTEHDMQEPAIPSLQASLDAKKADFESRADSSRIATFNEGVRQVAISGVLETALKVGDTAPDFMLPNATGDSVHLSTLLSNGPVVLTWYRGGWCPYCNMQLHAYNNVLDSIMALNGQLVAVSPEIPDSSFSTKERDSLHFQVLSDVGNVAGKEYGLVYTLPDTIRGMFKERLAAYNADTTSTLPLGATYVINKDRVITYAFIDGDYKRRAEPSAILAELGKLKRSM